MSKCKKAPRRGTSPDGRRAETIAAEQLIPQMHCITAVGGVQAARRRSIAERLILYGIAKQEFEKLQGSQVEPCGYDTFTKAMVEALRI